MPNGISINIPKNLKAGVEWMANCADWEKISISPEHKQCKVVQGCLLSKDGKTMYAFADRRDKYEIPNTVKTVDIFRWMHRIDREVTIVIPKSVTKICGDEIRLEARHRIKLAKGNKRFAMKNGCLYNKKTRRMVIVHRFEDGVWNIPEGITCVSNFMEYDAKKIIVPSSVEKVTAGYYDFNDYEEVAFIVKGKTPFSLSLRGFSESKRLIVYVPQGCKEAYEKKWRKWLFQYPEKFIILEQES